MDNKRNSLMISIAVAMMFLGGLVWADSNGVWHNAEDIRAGTFGADEAVVGNYIFNNAVVINNNLNVDTLETGLIKSNVTGGNVVVQLG